MTIVSLLLILLSSLVLMSSSDSWPYPEYRDVWDRIENTFNTEEDFEDLRIRDFVLAGRQTTRRRLDRLTMPWGQSSVLERGSLQLREHERSDASVDTALGYTSVVGTMLAEELANTEDQVGTLDRTLEYVLIAFLDHCSSGACPGSGTLRCSLQRGFGFVGREGARAGDVPAVDHGKAHHLACRCG